ncbi:formylglycine-generating enzyme required for sulfatase activity [Bradymonas sediminis]|uniref:Sulfatase-modifying factor enzyme-like domain-containing protein n=2 Tax=Bradymonas sediminis TaxID=1548548 RepID=A0A2Z4FQA4_9DELT|nr:hypothetical protein DN745_17735 [Bradymonas sediminis]TDP75186.1 formylglycine-generating enzyme required for sulfatase activity [Bradymonas sediminis]
MVTGDRVAQARLKASRARADRLVARASAAAAAEAAGARPAAAGSVDAPDEVEDPFAVEDPRSLSAAATTAPVDDNALEASAPNRAPKAAPPARPRRPVQPKAQANTYIEGLKAVDGRGESPQGLRPSDGAAGSDAGGTDTPRARSDAPGRTQHIPNYAGPGVGRRARLPIFVAITLSLTGLAVLSTNYWTSRAHQNAHASAVADLPARVLVEGGAYKRGLDEGVRSFIMQICDRTDNEPDVNCKHNRLFEGEYPQESVSVSSFEIDAGEVTVGAYQDCVDAGKCAAVKYKSCQVWTHQGLQTALRVPRDLQKPEAAQTCVSQAQARDFCAHAGGALPSADQWEKAARGTDARLFPWGNSWSVARANWAEMDLVRTPIVGQLDGFERVAPPGHFPEGKSPAGAYDMAGNAAEWVESKEGEDASARGGSWTSRPFDLRVTHRLKLEPDTARTDVGFRCVYQP